MSSFRFWHSLTVVAMSLAGAHLVGQDAQAQEESYRLGTDVFPTGQSVYLLLNADETAYSGRTRIQLEVRKAAKTFEFHAEDMTLTKVVLHTPAGEMELAHTPSIDHRVKVTAPNKIQPGRYTLEIEFENEFGTKAVGLYRMEYEDQGYAFTQFEADDAREAFPCWDEPSYKIPWELNIRVPEHHTAVTNTPVSTETVENGWRTIKFERTKPLPTYLIAIAAGTLEHVPIEGMSAPGNIVTVKGQEHLAGLAAEMAPPILAAMENYFDGPYPYRKLDLIAVPEYWPGAMEHPGAITFADNLLLIDPEVASIGQKSQLARVMSHEFAHLWFGDVVTMEWWDDLWLNESFADWMGDKIAHEVYPEYNIEVSEMQSSINVMNGDARPSAEAIQQPVTGTENLLQNVGVQYNKGKMVLAMFEDWMGPEVFRRGVLDYIEADEWGNAVAADLWSALDRASGYDVSTAMTSFIAQPGVPLVDFKLGSGNRVLLSQKRFSNFGVTYDKKQSWKIPVTFRYSDGKTIKTETVLLEKESRAVQVEMEGDIQWLLPNADQRGYYRWQVSPEMFITLAEGGSEIMNERERVGYLGNLSALLDAGVIAGDSYLTALAAFADDDSPAVIDAILNQLEKIELAFITPELEEPFAAYVQRVLTPALRRYGMEPQQGETDAVALFRPSLIGWLGDQGRDQAIKDWAQQTARSYRTDPTSIDPSMAGVSLRLSATYGNRALFEEYKASFESSEVPIDRRRYLIALANFKDPAIAADALQWSLTGPLRSNEQIRFPLYMMERPSNQDRVFEWFLENYDVITKSIPPIYLGLMPRVAGGCSAERLIKAEKFFTQPDVEVSGTASELAKVSDQVTDCVSLRDREGAKVSGYLNQIVGAR